MSSCTADVALRRLLDEGRGKAASADHDHVRLWEALADATEGGKRFRPALLLSVHDALAGELSDAAAEVGAAVELLHTAFVIHDDVIESAQRSPVYQFVKVWKVALPPHIEYRTLPMLFYVPPMSPVMAQSTSHGVEGISGDLFHDIEQARVPSTPVPATRPTCSTRCARSAIAIPARSASRWPTTGSSPA